MSKKGERAQEPETAADETATRDQVDEVEQFAQAPEPPETADEPVAASDPESRLKELEEENSDLKDQLLRKQADFENFRKRISRDKEEAIVYANQALLLDILTVIDDFERAIESAQESRDFGAFHDGVVLIERQLTSMLEKKWGLKRFESKDQDFDPSRHQAIATEEREGIEHPSVVEDYQRGYLLHERVLRPARVKVAQPPLESVQDDNTVKEK
jgi:molecular chaperone GrpE